MGRLTEGKCQKCGRLSHVRHLYTTYGEGKHAYICSECADHLPAIKFIFVPPHHSPRSAVVDTSWKNAKNKTTEPGKGCECGNLKKPHLACCKKCREAARTHHATLPREATEYEKGFGTGQMDHSAGYRLDSIWNRNQYEPMTDYVRGYRDGWDSVVWLGITI